MERLTVRLENGKAFCAVNCIGCSSVECDYIYKIIDKVAAYEDTGFTPEQVVEMAKELAELKKQLPPCKVGDTVYYPDNEHYFIAIPIKISEIVIGILDSVQYNGCFFDGNGDPETEFEFDNNDFGKTVFLTKEEAEAKLKEMEK